MKNTNYVVVCLIFVATLSSLPGRARADSTPALAPPLWQPPALKEGQHFAIDPIADGVIVVGSAALAGLLDLVISTNELQAQPPGPMSNLLSIDRLAVTQHIDPHAALYSNIGLYSAAGFAVLDTFLSGHRDGWDAALVDGILYAESASLTLALTDFSKIAVRRARPVAYKNCAAGNSQAASRCSSTDLELSFFSGHASTVAALGATATYLAFAREGSAAPRPWITLAASVALTSFVSVERVRAGQHFPTDVLAGAFTGATVGILVPHLHKHMREVAPVWIGFAPAQGGGSLTASSLF
jgi:membrane-associated phospholipid phosphatase